MTGGVPARMHAAYITKRGPASGIRWGELPTPVPGDGEVLVRVDAAAVDAVDTFVRSGAYATELTFPFVVGRDAVGTVAAPGNAGGFRPGERVWTHSLGHAGRQGAVAEYAVVPADRLYRVPDGVDAVELAAIVHAAATAFLAVHTHGGVRSGDTVLVAGAAGNVGRAAVQIAKDAGARVVATASAADLAACVSLGADEAFDYRDPELPASLRAATAAGVDVHLDTSGHHDLDLAVGLLAPRGRVVLLAGLRERPPLPVGALYMKDAQVRGFAISRATAVELAHSAALINRMMSAGTLAVPRIERLPMAAASEAHERLEAGGAHGIKLVLLPPRADRP